MKLFHNLKKIHFKQENHIKCKTGMWKQCKGNRKLNVSRQNGMGSVSECGAQR